MENGTRYKYPRTYHLPYSEKTSSDDKRMDNDNHFLKKEVIVSIKMDGENTTIYNDYSHARSINSDKNTEDRKWIEQFRSYLISGKLTSNQRICGENLFYRHQCKYDDLLSMFYVFSIWENDTCYDWNYTINFCKELNILPVETIYLGIYDRDKILEAFDPYRNTNEGFVVRATNSFNIDDFQLNVNKFVKSDFILPNAHWRVSEKTKNILKSKKNPWEF